MKGQNRKHWQLYGWLCMYVCVWGGVFVEEESQVVVTQEEETAVASFVYCQY